MAKIPFNVDAYTARLIGRENVSKLNGAIFELVKNTYDADATVCVLYYEESSGTVYLGDNGYGMTDDVILTNWMTIGRSSKKLNFVSGTGRIQTGAKGIGRFALDRIADSCEMLTLSEKQKLIWRVDWSSFQSNENITDVTADLSATTLTVDDFVQDIRNNDARILLSSIITQTGTIFRLTTLRDQWSKRSIKSIRDDLISLIPYEPMFPFKIYFFEENMSIHDAEITYGDGNNAYDYKVNFEVDNDGNAEIRLHRDEFDFGDQFDQIMHEAGFTQEDRNLFCGQAKHISTKLQDIFADNKHYDMQKLGPFQGALYFAKAMAQANDKEKFYYKSIAYNRQARDLLGGIRIYRDSFRVRPYGESSSSNYDWLLLSRRRNLSPAAPTHPTSAWRVGADQVFGSIFISRINIGLPDQANREGIVETAEFGILKEFILYVIAQFEKDRQYVFRKLSQYYDKVNKTVQIQEEINRKASIDADLHKNQPTANAIVPHYIEALKAKAVIDKKEEEIQNLEDENKLLRTLATTGIVTNAYIHEFKALSHQLSMKIVMAKEALEYDRNIEVALHHIQKAEEVRDAFSSWFNVTIESVRRDRRSYKNIDMYHFVSQIVDAWSSILKEKQVVITLAPMKNEIQFKCFPHEIDSIFSNLIANSVSAFGGQRDKREILIELSELDSDLRIQYSDTGPGLSPFYKKDPRQILEPFETDRRDNMGELIGTGMGMWIIHRTVMDYRGKIDLSENLRQPKGFFIDITLGRKEGGFG